MWQAIIVLFSQKRRYRYYKYSGAFGKFISFFWVFSLPFLFINEKSFASRRSAQLGPLVEIKSNGRHLNDPAFLLESDEESQQDEDESESDAKESQQDSLMWLMNDGRHLNDPVFLLESDEEEPQQSEDEPESDAKESQQDSLMWLMNDGRHLNDPV
ncbi:MAG: hypothetical protein LBB25_00645, partial [Holosporaceae bacterium]|nr:hypothetical protein [Holosporaceae bacterium]